MDRKRFNKEMDDYLKDRTRDEKKTFKFNVTKKVKYADQESTDPGVVEIDEGPGFFDWLRSLFTVEEEQRETPPDELTPRELEKLEKMHEAESNPVAEDFDDDVEDLNVPQPGFIHKLASFFGFGPSEHHDDIEDFDPEEYEEIDELELYKENVKELVKITHGWLEELSKTKKRAFKKSDDFENYKSLLKDLDLLKEKKEVEKELKDVEKKSK